MNHILGYNESDKFSDEQSQELLNSLKSLSHSLGRFKSYAEYQNRKSTMVQPDERGVIPGTKVSKLNDEYEEYFYSLLDDGWKYFRNGVDFYSEIHLKKLIKKTDAESELPKIVNEMTEVKNRFTDKGFNCHFLIDFDGMGQQETNPATHKSDVYKFKGIGTKGYSKYADEKEYPVSLFPRNEYFLATIKFIYI